MILGGKCLNKIGFNPSGPGDFLLLKSLKTCVSLSSFIQTFFSYWYLLYYVWRPVLMGQFWLYALGNEYELVCLGYLDQGHY